MDKIIIVILVLLVILVVLGSFFKADVVSWMRDRLPSYQAPPDNETIMTDDAMKYLNYEPVARVNSFKKSGDKVNHYYITFYKDYFKDKTAVISAPVFIDWPSGKEGASGNIEIITPIKLFPPSFFNEKVGSMTDTRIKIDMTEADYLKLKGKVSGLPDFSIFIKLNDAKYITGGIYRTK